MLSSKSYILVLVQTALFAGLLLFWSKLGLEEASAEATCADGAAMASPAGPVKEFRVALRSEGFADTVRLYRDELGFEQIADWSVDGHGEGVLLAAPRATLEILSAEHADYVDEAELGAPAGARVRFALSVSDVEETAKALQASGAAAQLAPPRLTPWGDRNIRMGTNDDVQVTLFAAPEADAL
ncbi:MAG: VOC family protein [Pseudomonadota bacterium]